MRPEEHFENFFSKKLENLEIYSGFDRQKLAGFSKNDFYVSRGTFSAKKL